MGSQKQPEPWKCLTCGAPMQRELDGPASQIVSAVARRVYNRRGRVVHLCGACKALHLTDDAGNLRRPTLPELFSIELQCGQVLDRIDLSALPDGPGGTVIL